MAILSNPLFEGMRGRIGTLIFKQYGNKTVVTAIPDMTRVVHSKAQLKSQQDFADAVAYARSIVNNPTKRRMFAATLAKNANVYQCAIKAYYKCHKK